MDIICASVNKAQWGLGSLTNATTKTEYYPIAFKNICYGITISDAYGYMTVGAEIIDKNTFKVYCQSNIGYFFFCIGQ